MAYFKIKQVNLTVGPCPTGAREISQNIEQENEHTTWCLSGLTRPAIRWQWSPDGSQFAYALPDKHQPTRQLSGRFGYTEVDHLNWYIMNANGTRRRRFSAPDPFGFQFSPDGQYAVYSTYNDYGKSQNEIVEIRSESLVCRYERNNLWYNTAQPPCDAIRLKNGDLWDIKTEVNRSACEFYVTSWGWHENLEANGCRELLKGTSVEIGSTFGD
jgi:hypothetical protein